MNPPDALALCMLGVFVLSLACLFSVLFMLFRNAGKEEEIFDWQEEAKEPAVPSWERKADWWKT